MISIFWYLKSNSVISEEPAVLKRDAFPHSLCTHAVKCKLEIEYVPLSKDETLRNVVTAAVRYTENKLRALIGVKSRLGIKEMFDDVRYLIDGYFDNIFEIERRRRERECAPEYEHLYDAESKELSFSDADEIERASWTTTARLIVDEDDDEDEKAVIEENVSEDVNVLEKTHGLSKGDVALIKALMEGGQSTISDDAFERINEAFLSSDLGDIILEQDGEEYLIIEDYREEISNWLAGLN